MRLTPEQLQELQSLTGAVADGTLRPEQHERLRELLRLGPEAREIYRQYLKLHGALSWIASATRVLPDNSTPFPQSSSQPIQSTRSIPMWQRIRDRIENTRTPVWKMVVTAMLSVGLIQGTYLWYTSRPVATLAEVVEAQWDYPFDKIAVGDALDSNPMILRKGYARIAFRNGTSLILQSPAVFRLESKDLARLSQGKLTANVPHEAIGFTVETPSGKITDLGTEFGVGVNADGSSEVQVFRGSVQAELTTPMPTPSSDQSKPAAQLKKQTVVLKEKQAVAFSTAAPQFKAIDAKPDNFVTDMRHARLPLSVHNTGYGLKPGDDDLHWRITAIESDPKTKPGAAKVMNRDFPYYLPVNDNSKWLSMEADGPICPWGARYTFSTTFDLTGLDPTTAKLNLQLAADNEVSAIRLNGRDVCTPEMLPRVKLHCLTGLDVTSGFVPGVNRLEVVVFNGPPLSDGTNPAAFRAELSGTAERMYEEKK